MISNTISVIIPVYNGERFLADAIQSLLAQTLPPAEILVVDDGSNDGTAQLVHTFGPPVQYLHQSNTGPAAARNLGVERSRGNLLAFLDADDLWTPTKLACQFARLTSDPACEAVLGKVENFLSPELGDEERRTLARAVQQGGDVHVGALLIRRSTFLRIGGFDTRWRHSEFVEWWARAMQLDLVYTTLSEPVLYRRLHATNLTRRQGQSLRQEYLAMLREKLVQGRQSTTSTEPYS